MRACPRLWRDEVRGLEKLCHSHGVAITELPLEASAYVRTRCAFCATGEGTSLAKPKPVPSRYACEIDCNFDEKCEAYDFDFSRTLCRTYEVCPASAVERGRRMSSCAWSTYHKPRTRLPLAPDQGPKNLRSADDVTPAASVSSASSPSEPLCNDEVVAEDRDKMQGGHAAEHRAC